MGGHSLGAGDTECAVRPWGWEKRGWKKCQTPGFAGSEKLVFNPKRQRGGGFLGSEMAPEPRERRRSVCHRSQLVSPARAVSPPHRAAVEMLQIWALPNPRPPLHSRHFTCTQQWKTPKLPCPESSGHRKSCKISAGEEILGWHGGFGERDALSRKGQPGLRWELPSVSFLMENPHPKETPRP